jgi:hypothetical protein
MKPSMRSGRHSDPGGVPVSKSLFNEVIAVPIGHGRNDLVVAGSGRSQNPVRNEGHYLANAELTHCPLQLKFKGHSQAERSEISI